MFIKYSILSLIAGIFELFGVALVYPFILKILTNSSKEINFDYVLLGVGIIILFLLKNLFMIFYTYMQARYTNDFETKIKKQFINHFFVSDYNKLAKISVSQKGKIFGLLIPNVMHNFILRLLNLNVNIVIFCLISVLIALKFPIATLITIAFALITITAQNIIYKPFLKKISDNVSKDTLANNQSYNEIVLNLKSIKISNNEKYFYDKYVKTQDKYAGNNKNLSFFSMVPPYVTEPCVIIMLFVLLLVISVQTYDKPEAMIASYALIVSAVFRLAPTISRIQVNYNGINASLPIVNEFLEIYEKYKIKDDKKITNKTFENFNESIELKDVSFAYENKNVLENINLKINKGEFIGIAGISGVGKTTLIDIISGLYKPSTGTIYVDGKIQTKPLKVGYIPQEYKLISGSIRENVAFGATEIDDNKVIDALKMAQLYDFVKENYEDGIYANPFVDSNGLSLGQRQRIAIARALYSDPDLLILDEATSSLDSDTEKNLCEALLKCRGFMTIIAVAHRISTIKQADRIVFMENKTISDINTYDDLITTNEKFRLLENQYMGKDTDDEK